MRHRFTKIFNNNLGIIKNASYLTIIQFISLALPFVSYGYLVKTVGLELFGIVILAQVIAAYPSILVAYGFNIYGPKQISENITSPIETSEIFGKIISAKLYLAILCFIFYIPTAFIFASNHALKIQIFVSSWVFLYEALNPIWYFQGVQALKKPTIYHALSKLIQLILIYYLITSPERYSYISLIYGIAALTPLVPLYFILAKEYNIRLHLYKPKQLLHIYKEAFDLFLTNISGAIYASSAKLFVGANLGYVEISLYDFAEKIVMLAKMPLGIVSQAFYPMNCNHKNPNRILRQIIILFLISCAGYGIFLSLADVAAEVIGEPKLYDAKMLLAILLLSLPLNAISGFGGINFLVPLGHTRQLRKASVVTTMLFLFGLFLLLQQRNASLLSFGYLTMASELIFAMLIGYLIIKYKNEKLHR